MCHKACRITNESAGRTLRHATIHRRDMSDPDAILLLRVGCKPRRIRPVRYWKTTLAIVAALSVSLALAEDFKTVDGKEYKDATVKRVEPDGVVIQTKSSISKVYFSELPKEVQQRFNYDPKNAAAYSAQQSAANEQFNKQEEEAAPQKADEAAKQSAAIAQIQNVQVLQERLSVLQQDEANLSGKIAELKKFPEYLSEHSRTGNTGWRHQYRYKNPARADLPALESQLTADRKEKGQVETQLKKLQHQ